MVLPVCTMDFHASLSSSAAQDMHVSIGKGDHTARARRLCTVWQMRTCALAEVSEAGVRIDAGDELVQCGAKSMCSPLPVAICTCAFPMLPCKQIWYILIVSNDRRISNLCTYA